MESNQSLDRGPEEIIVSGKRVTVVRYFETIDAAVSDSQTDRDDAYAIQLRNTVVAEQSVRRRLSVFYERSKDESTLWFDVVDRRGFPVERYGVRLDRLLCIAKVSVEVPKWNKPGSRSLLEGASYVICPYEGKGGIIKGVVQPKEESDGIEGVVLKTDGLRVAMRYSDIERYYLIDADATK